MAEIRRVLAPGGRLWVVDMVEHPVRVREFRVLAQSALAHLRTRRSHPQFAKDLTALTSHPDWREMLRHNPIRAEHEYRWYFESRFPGARSQDIDNEHGRTRGGLRLGAASQGPHRPPLLPLTRMTTNPCLGVIDWGIGGLGLVQALDRAAPGLPVLYWSDAGATPYGRMRVDELAGRLTAVVDELAERGASEVVLACNAASTVVGKLGAAGIPVEGIIEYGVASVPDELTGQVGVIGGRRTIAAGNYRRGLARRGRVVLSRVAQPLSAHIEAGRTGSAEFRSDLAKILAPLRRVDALVLACTHYPPRETGSRPPCHTPN